VGNVDIDTFRAIAENKPNLITWLDGLPFAWIDPCSRTLSFNTLQSPWDSPEMRWAVNYAIDRQEIVQDAYYNTTIAARHFFPAYPPLDRYVQLLEQAGLYDEYPLSTYDPDQARAMIEAQGWEMGASGYYERDGAQLALTIYAHEAGPEMRRTAELVALHLQDVGINATMEALVDAEWVERKTYGTFEALVDWDSCGSIIEPWSSMDRYHARWAKPLGEPVTNYNNQVRWSNAEYSALVDEMAGLPLGDPRVDELFVAAAEIWLDELPFLPLVQNKQLVSFDTTYWQNWPTANNAYVHPPSWWQSVHIIVHNLEPASE
jgi:peptide/nickel transport system substrate-binding protein